MDTDPERPPEDPAASVQPPDPGDSGSVTPGKTEPERSDGAADEEDVVITEATLDLGKQDLRRPGPRERSLLFSIVKDEVVRAAVALALLVLLAYVIFMAFKRAKTWEETKQLLDGVLPAVTALLGSAVGFYFGTKSN